jgi:hypothetical protein
MVNLRVLFYRCFFDILKMNHIIIQIIKTERNSYNRFEMRLNETGTRTALASGYAYLCPLKYRLLSLVHCSWPCHSIDLAKETGLVIYTSYHCVKRASRNVESFPKPYQNK